MRCVALAVLLTRAAGAQSPQELAAARQRESIERQLQSLAAQSQALGRRGSSASSIPAIGAPLAQATESALERQRSSIERQRAAVARQRGSSPLWPAAAIPAPAREPPPADNSPPREAAPENQAGLGEKPGSIALQLQSVELQPRLVWPEPPNPASVLDCAPLPVPVLGPLFERAAAAYRLDPSLLRAVARRESAFKPCAVSRAGAMGLMQLMPETAWSMGVEDPFDAEQSIFGGARFLRFLLDRFDNDLSLALSAYNAGPARVDRFGAIPPIPETQSYVAAILRALGKPPPE